MLPIKPSLLFILPPPLIVNFWSISSSWLLLFFINFAAFDLPLFALKISLLCYHKVLCCRHLASLGHQTHNLTCPKQSLKLMSLAMVVTPKVSLLVVVDLSLKTYLNH
ncbi:hypothetical protein ES319_D04G138800v1 [Gossypium barbadense]|uniref:Uncharacterized protein n=3 Tax=Gossypium TaxID=3633 RepID=A0A5J5RV96_GOSBA|nr:hypothetical protein ES319_D04G138800v1 [Gossypium barbadense]TYG74012.1 hypothetical protein ES288_D04G148200v1 [Gossypium darwinii]